MKIGILIAGHAPDEVRPQLGNYDRFFARLLADQGFTFDAYTVVDGQFPADIHAADGWLITGSRHGAYEDLPFIPPLSDFIRAAYDTDVPMVGICFGHQIIAQALGGHVEKYADGWAVGRQTYDWNGTPIALNAWHQDQVTQNAPDAAVYASNAFCQNAALVYGNRAFTVQAHPEFDSDFIDMLATSRGRGVVPDALLADAAAQYDAPNDNAFLAQQIGTFFKERSLA